MLRRARPLFPRPKFYRKCPNAEGVSPEYAKFILQHIVLQRLREKEEENLEHEKRESEIRRQSELPTDLTGKPRRGIQVDPIISPFDSGEDKTPGEDTYILLWSPKCPSTPDPVPRDTLQPLPVNTPEGSPIPSPVHSPTRPVQTPTPTQSPETPSSPSTPRCPIPCQISTSSRESLDSESDPIMMATTKELVEALTIKALLSHYSYFKVRKEKIQKIIF